MPETHQYTCPWCGRPVPDVSQAGCPSCGSPLDVRAAVSRSGWTELPPIRDMAKLQFGQSFRQVKGMYVPVADFKLAPGDGVYFTHHQLLWKDPQVRIAPMPLARGAWRRRLAGLPLVMVRADEPGRLAFSRDKPGDVVALPLSPGQAVDVCEHVFMAATSSVAYDWVESGFWYRIEAKRHYPLGRYMDQFRAGDAPGLLLLHGAGSAFVRHLAVGERVLVKPTALLFKDPAVSVNLLIEHPGGSWETDKPTRWAQRSLWARLTGPGRVAIQSHYGHWEDPDEPVSSVGPNGQIWDWY